MFKAGRNQPTKRLKWVIETEVGAFTLYGRTLSASSKAYKFTKQISFTKFIVWGAIVPQAYINLDNCNYETLGRNMYLKANIHIFYETFKNETAC